MKKKNNFMLWISLLIGVMVFSAVNAYSEGYKVKANGESGLTKIKLVQQQQQRQNQNQMTVTMNAQNDSNQVGTTTLTQVGNQTRVLIELRNSPNSAQPAHIHVGSCPNPGDIKYPLNDVVNGRSETTINVSMNDLLNQLPLAVNVHRSANDQNVFVSCGDIRKPGNDSNQCVFQQERFKIWSQRSGDSSIIMYRNEFELASTSTSPDAIANEIVNKIKVDRETVMNFLSQNQDSEFYRDQEFDQPSTTTGTSTATSTMMNPCFGQDMFKIKVHTMNNRTVAKVMMKFTVTGTDNQAIADQIVARLNQLTPEQIKAAIQQQR